MKNTAIRGKYKPQNPQKYKGNVNKIIYRSMWERRFMIYCDKSPHIHTWSSEELAIPYVYKGKQRTYYPDFVITYTDKHGNIRHTIIEIKPHYQCKWAQNHSKWEHAICYANTHNYEFKVLTERELF